MPDPYMQPQGRGAPRPHTNKNLNTGHRAVAAAPSIHMGPVGGSGMPDPYMQP